MATAAKRSVLHVLPHPGGGGETYVDLLAEMPGYRFERLYLVPRPSFAAGALVRGLASVVREARNHDLVHVHGEAAAGFCLPVLATRPSLVTLHGMHLVRRLSGPERVAAVLNLRAVLRAADRTICVSESECRELTRAAGTKAARRAVVIRNGVHVPPGPTAAERLEMRESLDVSPAVPVAIWVGSLDERKDPLAATRAARDAQITLLVVGDGPLRAKVEQERSSYIRVLGVRHDVGRLLAASDIFVLTSRREGLAFSLLEAMAHGLVPVVADLFENLEAIGDTGLAVPAGDERALKAALRCLVENGAERATLAEKAVRRAADHFAVERMFDQTGALYDEVLSGR